MKKATHECIDQVNARLAADNGPESKITKNPEEDQDRSAFSTSSLELGNLWDRRGRSAGGPSDPTRPGGQGGQKPFSKLQSDFSAALSRFRMNLEGQPSKAGFDVGSGVNGGIPRKIPLRIGR